MTTIDRAILSRILTDPATVYQYPHAVLSDDRLSREEKIQVLERWAFDARELQVAEEENMGPGDAQPTYLHDVLVALDQLKRA